MEIFFQSDAKRSEISLKNKIQSEATQSDVGFKFLKAKRSKAIFWSLRKLKAKQSDKKRRLQKRLLMSWADYDFDFLFQLTLQGGWLKPPTNGVL